MKKLLNLVIVAGLAMTAAAAAHAQVPSALGSGDIKLGIFEPTGNTATYSGGSTQLAVGADYTTPGTVGTPRATFYGDYQEGSRNTGHVDTVGLGIATKYSQGLVGSITKFTPYFGVGVGVYREYIKNGYSGEASTDNTIGGKLFAGLTFNKYLLEANYQFLPSHDGVNPSGFGVQVGLTF